MHFNAAFSVDQLSTRIGEQAPSTPAACRASDICERSRATIRPTRDNALRLPETTSRVGGDVLQCWCVFVCHTHGMPDEDYLIPKERLECGLIALLR